MTTFVNSGNTASFFDESQHGIKVIECYEKAKVLAQIPNFVKYGLASLLGYNGLHRMKKVLLTTRRTGIVDLFKSNTRLRAYCQMYEEYLEKAGVSIVVSPGVGMPAFSHGKSGDFVV